MTFWQNVLRVLDARMTEPQPYGAYHLIWFALSFVAAFVLCWWHKRSGSEKRVRQVIAITAFTVMAMEIYKLINFSFEYENGVSFDFDWHSFPWQFCSTPMYVGALTVVFRKGKVHDSLCAYLATYAMFAGLIVMILPTTVFTETIGVNVQTMFCHGSMIAVAIYLMYTGYVKLEHKTILKALPVFAVTLGVAVILNEWAYYGGLLEHHTFNMFNISRHVPSEFPVFSQIQPLVPHWVSLVLYVGVFTLAAYLMLLIGIVCKKIAGCKNGKEVNV